MVSVGQDEKGLVKGKEEKFGRRLVIFGRSKLSRVGTGGGSALRDMLESSSDLSDLLHQAMRKALKKSLAKKDHL